MAVTKEQVEFKTQDGTILRGNLTLTGVPNAPAVIMIAGVRHAPIRSLILINERIANEKYCRNSLLSSKSTVEPKLQKHLTKLDMPHCYMITGTGDLATGCHDNTSTSSNRLRTCQMQSPTWPTGQT